MALKMAEDRATPPDFALPVAAEAGGWTTGSTVALAAEIGADGSIGSVLSFTAVPALGPETP
jgi:hypothetical protein